jgi:hypothetical protein
MSPLCRTERRVTFALWTALLCCAALWFVGSDLTARWAGVPPVPSPRAATAMMLGDAQLAYRSGAMTLQNLGDSGGRVTPLKEYDYARLGQWFATLDALDPAADHVPMIAAYYFGATRVPGDIRYVIDYLEHAGDSPVAQKWRWLAHAAYLSRHRLNDMPRALDIAYKLARLEPLDGRPLPLWARQMPALLLGEQGDRDAARALIMQMLMEDDHLHPNEVNFMRGYLSEQLGVPAAEVDRLLRMRAPQAGSQ